MGGGTLSQGTLAMERGHGVALVALGVRSPVSQGTVMMMGTVGGFGGTRGQKPRPLRHSVVTVAVVALRVRSPISQGTMVMERGHGWLW